MKNLLRKGIYVSMAATSAISGLAVTNSFAEDAKSVKEYSVPVKLKKVDSKETESMGNKAIKNTATVVEKDGTVEITLDLQGMKFMNMNGHVMKLQYFDTDQNSKLNDSEVVKSVKEADLTGKLREFPSQIKIRRNASKEKYILLRVSVDAMDSISSQGGDPYLAENIGKGGQNTYLELDYDNAKLVKDNSEKENTGKDNSEKDNSINNEVKIKSSRISGNDRYETSVAISKANYSTADTVVLANGVVYADALAAAPLASLNSAPILLSESKNISPATLSEISRLKAKSVIVVGGENSISSSVVKTLEKQGLSVERISGNSRYSTALNIAKKIREKNPASKDAIVVSGENFADALSVSSLANENQSPIILTASKNMSKDVEKELNSWGVNKLTVVGGKNSVSDAAVSGVKSNKFERIQGNNRYETSALVVGKLANTGKLMLASGEKSADALSAGAVTLKSQRPLLLVSKNAISKESKELIKNNKINDLLIIGGFGSISADILKGL